MSANSPPVGASCPNGQERIGVVIEGLKNQALDYELPVVAVAAADDEECAEGGFPWQISGDPVWYRPSATSELLKPVDNVDDGQGFKAIKFLVEKNRTGRANILSRTRCIRSIFTYSSQYTY